MLATNIQRAIKVWHPVSQILYVPHTEKEYHNIVELLDKLIDEVGEDENHPFKLHGNKNGHHKGETISPMSNDIKNKISESLKKKWKEQDHPTKGLEPWNKNKKGLQVAWNKGKEMEKIECPHCGKLSDKLNAKKWHFDNCKFKKSDT